MSSEIAARSSSLPVRLLRGLQVAARLFVRDWSIFVRNRLSVIGIVLLAIFSLMAIAHPILMSTIWSEVLYDPELGYDLYAVPWPSAPSPDHWLGTDALGRDIFSELLASTQPAFTLVFVTGITTGVVGLLVGAIAAYFRGPVDLALSTLSDAMLILPVPLIMVIIGSAFYDEISTVEFGILYGVLSGAGSVAIVLRAYALRIMALPFIEASRVSGATARHIIFWHLIPSMLPLAVVQMMFSAVGAVIADGFVAFVGYRTELRLNWGMMVYNAVTFLNINPQLPLLQIVAPMIALSLFAAALYCVARGLQDVADPHSRGR